jgi:N-acetylglucosaminyldiphosphoundecaprenol N-acetyl-beta-D-mannosaminyltransferase
MDSSAPLPETTAKPPGEGYVLGTPLQLTSYSDFTAWCQVLARRPGVATVDFTNTHIVTWRRHDPRFRNTTSQFDYFVPDGMPLIWCLNRGGARLRDRVYGPTFMRHCVLASPAPYTHFFLGGSAVCLERLQSFFQQQNAEVRIIGARNGYFSAAEEPDILDEINRLSPDFVWVGLGTPKQQDWIHRYKSQIRRGVVLAVGFAFDVNAGMKKDAPAWIQGLGLTWLFRMLSEPRRLVHRYVKFNSLFLWYLVWDGLRGRAFAAAPSSARNPGRNELNSG